MNKKELVEYLSKNIKNCSKTETEIFLNSFINTIKTTLKKGKKVTITGFGTFSTKTRKARMGINPQTGERIKIPAIKVAKFTTGTGLKKAVR